MRVLLAALFLLIGVVRATSSAELPVEASARSGPWQLTTVPGALIATRDGREVWRRTGPLNRPGKRGLLVTPDRVLLLSQETGAYGMTVVLSAYVLNTGKPLWTRRLYEHHGVFEVELAGTVGRAVLVTTGGGDVHWPDISAFDLGSGDAMWRMGGPVVGKTATEVLSVDPGVGDPNQTIPAWSLPLTRASGTYHRGARVTPLDLKIPRRRGCGFVAYQNGFPGLRFSNRYVYALRRDACGRFVARFDWHAGPMQTPLVYPDRWTPPLTSRP